MASPALRGHHSREPQPPDWDNNPKPSMGQPCPYHPDVLAVARDLGVTRDRDLRHFQGLYDRFAASASTDFDFGAHVLTYLSKHRRASVPVDTAVGERATHRLMKESRR